MPDGQRAVGIGQVTVRRRHEEMARHTSESFQEPLVLQATVGDLFVYHPQAQDFFVLLHGDLSQIGVSVQIIPGAIAGKRVAGGRAVQNRSLPDR